MQLLKCVFLVIMITPLVSTECIVRNCTRIPHSCQYCEFENIYNLPIPPKRRDLPDNPVELKLVNCHFGAFKRGTVRHEIQIHMLWVENSAEFIEDKAFTPYTEAYLISFTKNNISLIPNNAFQGLSKLDTVDFSQNRIVEIGENVFTCAFSITHLNLSHNRIESFCIKELVNLEWVNLDNNLITVLSELPKSLYGAHFNFNRLTKIANGTFHNMKFLRRIELHWNNITEIESEAFYKTEHLEYVDFSFNNLTIFSKVMDGLRRLHSSRNEIMMFYKKFEYKIPTFNLNLQQNEISSFSFENLNDVDFLICLDLSQNSIKQLDKSKLNLTINIKALDLSLNEIKTVPIGFFNVSRHIPIESVNLSTNAITQLEVGSFLGLSSLEHLDLSHNRIETLNETIFLDTPNLLALNLTDNRISYLNGYKIVKITHLNFVEFDQNEFSCLHLLSLIHQFESSRVNVMIGTNISAIKCKNPHDLQIKIKKHSGGLCLSTASIVIISAIILFGVAIMFILMYINYYKTINRC